MPCSVLNGKRGTLTVSGRCIRRRHAALIRALHAIGCRLKTSPRGFAGIFSLYILNIHGFMKKGALYGETRSILNPRYGILYSSTQSTRERGCALCGGQDFNKLRVLKKKGLSVWTPSLAHDTVVYVLESGFPIHKMTRPSVVESV